MNRRQFFQSLLAAAAAVHIPLPTGLKELLVEEEAVAAAAPIAPAVASTAVRGYGGIMYLLDNVTDEETSTVVLVDGLDFASTQEEGE